uniref:ELL associated factor 1 n=1 Tax=Aquila chrysaetos chrysaetos TaxID=223781 RepID=A0A663EBG7_AQUCH
TSRRGRPLLPCPQEGGERRAPTSPPRDAPPGTRGPSAGTAAPARPRAPASPHLVPPYPPPAAPEHFPGCTRPPEGRRAAAHGGEEGTGRAGRGGDGTGRDWGHERLGELAAGQGGAPAAAGRELRAAAQGLLPHDPLAEGSSKIQARIEQQSARASQPPSQFRAPTKPAVGPKTSPLKDNPSPEPQLDDIKRELRAEVEIIEQMSSSSGSSSSDSESSSGSEDESSSSEGEEPAHVSPSQPPHQQYNNRNAVANGTSRPQGSNQLMNTLRNDLQLSESGSDSDD